MNILSSYCCSKPMPLSCTLKSHCPCFFAGRDMDLRGPVGRAELERVAEQVLENLRQLRQVGADRRQRIVRDVGPAFLDPGAEIPQGGSKAFWESTLRNSSPRELTRE